MIVGSMDEVRSWSDRSPKCSTLPLAIACCSSRRRGVDIAHLVAVDIGSMGVLNGELAENVLVSAG